jgi:hypothetical protein
MQTGDRVRLDSRVAKTFNASRPRKYPDWTKRVGEVVAITRTGVMIRWDDRRSLDQWPTQAITVVNDRTK